MPTSNVTRPDWVMIGISIDTGVRLIASKELNYADLEVQRDHHQDFSLRDFSPIETIVRQRIKLTADLRIFTIIDAPDYPSAFDHLFKTWSPAPAQAITGKRQIEG